MWLHILSVTVICHIPCVSALPALNLATALQLIKFSEFTVPNTWYYYDMQGNSLVLTNKDTGNNLEKWSLSDGFSQVPQSYVTLSHLFQPNTVFAISVWTY